MAVEVSEPPLMVHGVERVGDAFQGVREALVRLLKRLLGQLAVGESREAAIISIASPISGSRNVRLVVSNQV
ncbi:MAG: hypothetical protein M3P37_13550 [Actinomycetota bacterium]|nr:hypothetical protein [Actinomycetota bacterium]